MNRPTLTPTNATKDATTFFLIICGGRYFQDREKLYYWADHYLQEKIRAGVTIIIVEGGCRRYDPETLEEIPTADSLARDYAHARGFGWRCIPAAWKLLGKAAGPRRNAEMGNIGHACLAFWNKKSSGTGNMITLARSKGLPVRVITVVY